MKLTAILLLGACLSVAAKSEGQTVTLSVKNAPMKQVFKEIQKQTGLNVLVEEALLQRTGKVTLDVRNMPVSEVLNICLKNEPLSYIIEDGAIVVKQKPSGHSGLAPVIPGSDPESIDVTGKVTDPDGNPLEGATVAVKGTKNITKTDAAGVFILKGVDENATLIFSYAEHETISVGVSPFIKGVAEGRGIYTVVMKRTEGELKEVIINKGYYKTNKITEVGNVSTVIAKEIERQPVTNVLLAMQGRMPGVQITQANGMPGSGVTVRVRGQNSIGNGNDPLYIIDGVPFTSQLLPGLGSILGGSGGSTGQANIFGSPLSFINPNEIERVDVLKDADATAIYGSRGANGVVLITTKKGSIGSMNVSINFQSGWGKVTRTVKWLNTRQYLDMRYEAFKNDAAVPQPWDYDILLWDTTRYTDWNKKLIGGNAHYNNLQVSLSGGNANTQYYIGYGYNKQTTVMPGSFGDPRSSLSINLTNSSANKKFKVQLSANYVADKNSLTSADLSSSTSLAPNAPEPYKSDGTLNWQVDPVSGAGTWANPYALLNREYINRTTNLIGNGCISYKVFRNLELKTSLGYTNMQTNEIRTSPLSSVDPSWVSFYLRTSSFSNNRISNWIVEPQIDYTEKIFGNDLRILFGSTFQENNSDGLVLNAEGFNSDLVLKDINSARTIKVNSAINSTYKYCAFFGRMNYDVKNKYLINLTARRDGTSRFGPENRFSNFAAVGAGWIFSKEAFVLKKLPFLSFGKIRASYGSSGNDQIGDYRYMDLYQPQNFDIPYQNIVSLIAQGLYNPDLAWEKTNKSEVGVELGFFKNRINTTVSYFRHTSSNQLLNYQIPSTAGYPSVPANQDAKVKNVGWEVQVNSINISKEKFLWTTGLNFTSNQNELVQLGSRAYLFDKRLVGQPLGTRFVYRFGGVDPVTGGYLFIDSKGNTTSRPDTAFTLNSYPVNLRPEFFGGIQNSISVGDFELDFLFQFVKQKGITNEVGNYPGSIYSKNQPLSVLERWTKPGDVVNIQRFYQDFSLDQSFEFARSSDAVVSDASYIRLKNISFSWNVPEKMKKKLHLKSCRVFLLGQNILTITKYKGADPENQSLTSLPPLRVWTAGAQLTF